MSRADLTAVWAANELIGFDLDATPIADIVDELADRIFVALSIDDEDEAAQDWAFGHADRLALAITA